MGNIWVREFTGGLDTRRMSETTSGGVLVKALNGHISRGGEFQKRAAFVEAYELPAGETVGLAAGRSSLYAFGHAAAPTMPTGVTYQRIQHPDEETALAKILSVDLYAGKLYVVGEFADGGIYHYYDGVRVEDWYDGRARASFDVTAGGVIAATQAVGSFEISGGTNDIANQLTALTIDGVSLIAAAVTHTGNNATTAAAVAAAINSHNSTPEYTASANGQLVTVTATATGTAANGKAIVRTVTGDFTTSNATNMGGGAVAVPSRLLDISIDGVSVISTPVSWSDDAVQMAASIASAITSYTSTPDYSATSNGAQVNVVATTAGAGANGRAITFSVADGLVLDPASGLLLTGGSDDTTTYQPGGFAKTIGKKVYSTSGPNMHFSGIAAPTQWTTDAVGAGFIDMSSETSGAEELVALAKYQNQIAVFAERVVQIWYIDPDPALNRQSQVLNNTGTISPKSVTQFGDNDIFYLDESGLRSLRARDSSNSAATTDIGVPIDTLIVEKLAELSLADRQDIIGAIEPRDGRFWLAAKDVIFVFSFFNGAKVSAWSTYEPSIIVDGEEQAFEIDEMVVFQRRVFLRSGDKVYVYGGLGAGITYDGTVAEAWLPYLDGNAPSREKNFTGIDAALEGVWTVAVAMQPTEPATEDEVATLSETTFNLQGVPAIGRSTHISLRFRTSYAGPARLSSAVIHYEGDQIENK